MIALEKITEESLTAWQEYYNVKIQDIELLPLIKSPLNKQLYQRRGRQPTHEILEYTILTCRDRLWTFIFLAFTIPAPLDDPSKDSHRLMDVKNKGNRSRADITSSRS